MLRKILSKFYWCGIADILDREVMYKNVFGPWLQSNHKAMFLNLLVHVIDGITFYFET